MIYRITLILSILLFSCNTTGKLQDNEPYIDEHGMEVTTEETDAEIIFQLKNTNDYPVYLSRPDQLTIQKQEGDNWERVRILYCPCGASCPPPREFVSLQTNDFVRLKWNKKESWCVDVEHQMIPETKERKASQGNYRMLIQYGQQKKKQTKTYYEFKLN